MRHRHCRVGFALTELEALGASAATFPHIGYIEVTPALVLTRTYWRE
ncbi:hypothetical protein [Haloprofundus salilacus]|nr:hypothetical protein [Haloprofundus salilacus]